MAKFERIIRQTTPEERARHAEVRRAVEAEFPPLSPPSEPPFKTRVAIAARQARLAGGLSPEEVAQRANIPDVEVVRSIEAGDDVPLLYVEAVIKALGLKLEVVSTADC